MGGSDSEVKEKIGLFYHFFFFLAVSHLQGRAVGSFFSLIHSQEVGEML